MDYQTILSTTAPILTVIICTYSRIDKKFEKMEESFKEIRSEIKDIRSEIKELRTGLNRIEGAFYSKDCCVLKDDKINKKVE